MTRTISEDRMRVLLVGCAALPEGDGDERPAARALTELGIDARWAVWDDPAEDFARADLVVLRATWDYPARRKEFLDWCASVPNLRNPVEAVRWNTDKSYLVDLQRTGLPVVPTELIAPGEAATWPEGDFVVKPTVGAGSRGAARFTPRGHAAATEHLRTLHEADQVAAVQPFQRAVDAEGETALVFFGGQYSHAFTKGPMLRGADAEAGVNPTRKLALDTPEPAWRALAEDALDAAAAHLGVARSALLYARVDVLRAGTGEPVLLELEVSEPSLGFAVADAGAALRFASAVRSA